MINFSKKHHGNSLLKNFVMTYDKLKVIAYNTYFIKIYTISDKNNKIQNNKINENNFLMI